MIHFCIMQSLDRIKCRLLEGTNAQDVRALVLDMQARLLLDMLGKGIEAALVNPATLIPEPWQASGETLSGIEADAMAVELALVSSIQVSFVKNSFFKVFPASEAAAYGIIFKFCFIFFCFNFYVHYVKLMVLDQSFPVSEDAVDGIIFLKFCNIFCFNVFVHHLKLSGSGSDDRL